ncbi:MAG TPA: VOC family protein [Gaiellaceae bacterium]|nr:VOC family protein [Gaiellaceae bacterium]
MLADARIGANVPVSDLDQAVAFYEGRLGLALFERDDDMHYARFAGAGETKLGVYESATAGQARHTLASFVVDDVRATVAGLKANGVVFEEYDLPGMKTEDGVATVGDTRVAWLKDPDGNILEIAGA